MVVQRTIDNMKARPQDERTAAAGGIAGLVVALLFIAWAFYFFHRIQTGAQDVNFAGVQNQIAIPGVQQAQQDITQQMGNTADELKRIRDAAAAQQAGNSQQQTTQVDSGTDKNQFTGQ